MGRQALMVPVFSHRLPYLTRLRSTSLNVSADDKPVVMETGFIESMDENNETQSRYQVG